LQKEETYLETRYLTKEVKTAFLIGVYNDSSNKKLCEDHLEELMQLSKTYGLAVLGQAACPLKIIDTRTYLKKGKIAELVESATNLQADIVIFDEEISPNQEKNLEKLFKKPILDRTELILEVFAQRAQTKEAKLQIELAKSRYQLPRLKRMWTHLSRQAASGGNVHLRGAGERQIEIDRRLVKKRIAYLQKELQEVRAHRQLQRRARIRSGIPTIAIVGYTNSGKSTLLHALTKVDVIIEDKLFATLDTTTRKFTLPNHQEVLFIDTVGFIRKLPHTLIAAFKSTLEEVLYTDLLIHLIDVSHPMAIEQAEITYEVLKELQALRRPMITVLNKIDKIVDRGKIQRFRIKYPKTIAISALTGEGFDLLLKTIAKELQGIRHTYTLRVPQKDYGLLTHLLKEGEVIDQFYEENDIIIKMALPKRLENQLTSYIVPPVR